MSYDISKIRNFSIIAHIDHGKSTLSDRLIQMCNGLEEREMKAQVLDSMDIERERGITIKAQTVRLNYKAKDGYEYILNLIDTPGHVDFTYEVSRSLAACEGSILLVDATQGVEAQTVANAYKAIEANHEIIPVLNKVDLPSSNVEKSKKQIEDIIGIEASNAICISAKTGIGVDAVLEEIVNKIPAPKSNSTKTKALLVDAWYDIYLGVILLIRVIDGCFKKGDKIKTLSNGNSYSIESIGFFTPKKFSAQSINGGEIGYITANIKNVKDCNIGDTIVFESDNESKILSGFKKVKPVVFCSIYPIDVSDYSILKEAIDKLLLNDSSVSYEIESSNALGIGFRCGFLGLLHLEVFAERISREFNIEIITTSPSVVYRIFFKKDLNVFTEIANPVEMPDPSFIDKIEEPYALLTIFSQEECVGDIIKLCQNKRGEQQSIEFSENRAIIKYKIPMVEIISEFHDKLKSISRGYASHEYEFCDYRASDIVKVGILLNGDLVEALSFMTHRSNAERKGRVICEKLKEVIPQHMFAVPIQAAIGGKIIARETISALRKDVTAKCYGGDISRKKKLLDKQKEGKKKMKMIGNVEVPKEAFLEILTVD